MATIADIILNDGAATPVAHTFKVKSNDMGVSRFEDRASGIPVGFGLMIVKTEETANVRKVMLEYKLPTLEAVSGANAAGFTPAASVAYVTRVKVEFFLPQRGTTQERKNVLAFLSNGLSNTTIKSIIVDGEEFTG